MKKRLQDKQDVAGMLNQIQQQLTFLDKKLDTLISQPSSRPVEVKHFPRKDNDYRDRVLHKAICADCNKECEVPFRPSGDRPVYCKDCFSKRKARDSFKGRDDNRPFESGPAHVRGAGKAHGGERKTGARRTYKKPFHKQHRPDKKT